MTSKIKFAARSEVGYFRKNNEDNLFCNGVIMKENERDKPFFINGICEAPCVFAVFDGMGGMDSGELASLTAAESLCGHAERINHGTFEDMNQFAHDANAKLLSIMKQQNIQTGTTLALISSGTKSFAVFNLGDSRVYVRKGDTVIQVTDDHTVTAEKLRAGKITPKQAMTDRYRNVLTRCLGMSDSFSVSPDLCGVFPFIECNRAMICSDGLTDMLTHKEIAEIMKRDEDVSEIVNELVNLALNNGGHDNVTCIVIDFHNDEIMP